MSEVKQPRRLRAPRIKELEIWETNDRRLLMKPFTIVTEIKPLKTITINAESEDMSEKLETFFNKNKYRGAKC